MNKKNLLNHNMKTQVDILSLCYQTANDGRVWDTFQQVLNLPPGTTIDYV